MSSKLQENLNAILAEKLNKVKPENIKYGNTIFGVDGIAGKANVYLQRNEPTEKEGIWIQAKDMTYDKIFISEKYIMKMVWDEEDVTELSYQFYDGAVAVIGTDIYRFGGDSWWDKYVYKYDTITNEQTQLTNMPYALKNGRAVAIGTDIYLFGGSSSSSYTKAYKYDTLTDIYTQLTDIPSWYWDGAIAIVGTDVYLLGRGSAEANKTKNNIKYDTLTDTYTTMKNIPYYFYDGCDAVAIGTDIYLFGGAGGTTNAYKYDTLTDTYTQLTDIPYEFTGGSITAVGTNIYLFGGAGGRTTAYEYNTLTDTYTQFTNIPYEFSKGSTVTIGNSIYLLGGFYSYTAVRKLVVNENGQIYPDASILLSVGVDGYETQLVNANIEGRLISKIADVSYYTVESGLNELLPACYGDSEKWVCFKNEDLLLPDEEPEEEEEIPLTVSYIESDGSQYIDTGIATSSNLSVEFAAEVNSDDTDGFFIGGRDAEMVNRYGIRLYKGNEIYFYTANSGYEYDIVSNVTSKHVYRTDKHQLYIDDVLSVTASNTTFNGTNSMYIFADNNAGTNKDTLAMKLYYCKIWDGDNLVRDFVPHLENGEYCLLDNVSGEVFLSPNGTSFTGHSERSAQVEYIQSLGDGEYIDTEIVPTANTEVEIQFEDTEPFIDYERLFAIDKQFGIMRNLSSTTAWRVECGNSWLAGDVTIPEGGIHTVKMGKNTVLVDGENSFSYSGSASTDKTLYIFQGNGTNEAGAFKLYYFKVWEDGTLIRDFVPYIVDDVYCLKDLVSGQYFYAQNGSSLIGGNVVTVEPPDETRLYRLSESTTFDGTSTEIDTGVAQSELAGGYSILMRINAEEWGNYRGVFGLHSSAGGIVGLQYENGTIRWLHNTDSSTKGIDIAEADLAAGSWHTIGCIFDGATTMNLYIDGVLYQTATTYALQATGNIIIGKAYSSSDRFFKGEISNFDIYNRAMEQDEVLQKLEAMEV